MSKTELTLDNMETMVDDETIGISNIYDYIIEYIKEVEKMKDIKGVIKKNIVYSKLKDFLPTDIFNRFEPMLDMSIDYIIYLSKNPDILTDINKIVKCCDKKCGKIFKCCK
jgi:hypothetical protein